MGLQFGLDTPRYSEWQAFVLGGTRPVARLRLLSLVEQAQTIALGRLPAFTGLESRATLAGEVPAVPAEVLNAVTTAGDELIAALQERGVADLPCSQIYLHELMLRYLGSDECHQCLPFVSKE